MADSGVVRKGRGFTSGRAGDSLRSTHYGDATSGAPAHGGGDVEMAADGGHGDLMGDERRRAPSAAARRSRSRSRSDGHAGGARRRSRSRSGSRPREHAAPPKSLRPRDAFPLSTRYSAHRTVLAPGQPNVVALTGLPDDVDSFAAGLGGADVCVPGAPAGDVAAAQALLASLSSAWERVAALEQAAAVAVAARLAAAQPPSPQPPVRMAQLAVRARAAAAASSGAAPPDAARPQVLLQMTSEAAVHAAVALGSVTLRGLACAVVKPAPPPPQEQPAASAAGASHYRGNSTDRSASAHRSGFSESRFSSSNTGSGSGGASGGGAVALSNQRRNLLLIAGTTSTSALTEDALAAMRARLEAQGVKPAEAPAPRPTVVLGPGGMPVAPPSGTAPAATVAASLLAAATGAAPPPPAPPPLPAQPPPPPPPAALAPLPPAAAIAAAADPIAQAQAIAAAISSKITGVPGGGSGVPGAGGAAGAGGAGVPLLGPSGTASSAPMPGGGGNVQIGTTPAAAAGLLGPSGLMGLLASISPTRVLVLLNAVTDAELRNEAELADIVSDVAIEAQTAITAASAAAAAQAAQAAAATALLTGQLPPPLPSPPPPVGRLIAVRIPRPRPGANERADPILVRRARPPGAAEAAVAGGVVPPPGPGGIGPLAMLEDMPTARRTVVDTTGSESSLGRGGRGVGAGGKKGAGGDAGSTAFGAIPTNARAFFERIFAPGAAGAGGGTGTGTASGAVGLLTDAGGGTGVDRKLRAAAQALIREERAAAEREDAEAAAGGDDVATGGTTTGGDTRLALYGAPAPPPPTAEELDRDPLAGRTRGLGRVFLEFSSPDAAVAVQKELSGRAFSGRILATSFADEEAYCGGRLCDFSACSARA